MFCSWDAEEYGLTGSLEFTELYAVSLSRQAIAYLNVDIGVRSISFTITSVFSYFFFIKKGRSI